MRILVAEDDAPLAEFIRQGLRREHFDVQVACDGLEAQRMAADSPVDLLLLDLNLPGATGFEVLQHVRKEQPELPVLIMTGKAKVEERVHGLDAGADDYLTKPFAFTELSARIRALLRRGGTAPATLLRVEDLELDRMARTVRRAGNPIELSPKEFALLECLMGQPGKTVSRAMIVERVWKLNFDTMTNVVDVYINYLRRKVDSGHDRRLIRTIRGIGYQIGETG